MTEVADRTARYVAAFEAFARNGASGAPGWLRELREGAIGRFAELGFPTMKQEEWRFTSVAPIADQRFILAHDPSSPGPSGTPLGLPAPSDIERLCVGAGPRVVFVDGRHAPTLSTPADLAGGVRAASLATALRTDAGSGLASAHLARHARWRESAFAALNTAFLADGAFVHVPAHVVLDQPLEVVFVSTAPGRPDRPTVSHPRSLIVLEPGARAAVVETYAGVSDDVYWTNAVTEVVVGDGARAELY